MLKKVMSIGLMVFFCLGANTCSEAMNAKKWGVWKKSLANQQSNEDDRPNNKKQDEDSEYSDPDDSKDGEFNPDEKNVAKEDEIENRDLEDMSNYLSKK